MCDDCDWEAALEMVDKISDMVSAIPEAGDDFAGSILVKSEDIGDWIAGNEHVTEAQYMALQNMVAGAKAWLVRE